MRSKRYFSMIIALAVFAIMSNYAFASTWYVDQATGNDADNGTTQALAKQTIQAMVGSASVINGDIVIVGNGTYIEQVRILNKGITLKSANGASVTTIKAPTYLSLTSYTEAGNLAWNDAIQGAGKALPSDVVMPVLFLDCPNAGYTNNVYGFTIDGDNQAQTGAGAEKSLVGILIKNTAGTIGSNATNQPCIIKNCQTTGATPWMNDNRNGYGIMVIGNSNCTIQYCTITTYQSAGIAVIGKNTTAGAATQNPIPNIFDNSIRGSDADPSSVDRANDGWYTGILVSYGGRGTIRRNILSDHYNSNGTNLANNVLGVGAGMYLIDVRTITIGSTSVKTDGNVSANNEYGLMVNVTNGAIPVTSLTIQRNNFVYNGDVVTDRRQDVRYVNSGTAASSSLNMSNNAFGNSEANSGFSPLLYTLGTGAANAFIAEAAANDYITYTSVLAPTSVDVNCTYTLYNTGVEWGYTKVNTVQRGVNSVATGFTNFVKVAECAGTGFPENVLIQKTLKLVGDSVATCATRPTINPTSGYAVTVQSPANGPSVDEVVVNGFHFLQAGAQNAGVLVVGRNNNDIDDPVTFPLTTNYPPTGTQLRNNCWEGYSAQAAEAGAFNLYNDAGPTPPRAAVNTASIATSSVPWGGALHSYNMGGAPQPSDVDAQSNNNFNYNGSAALPSRKVWEVADDANDARILFNNLIIVHCGESINTAVAAVSSGGTIYIEGNCVYTEDVVVDKAITFRTIYDGLPLPKYPPVIQGINSPMTFSNGAAGSACGTTFATGAANTDSVYFWNPSTITTAFPAIYTTNDGAALATGQFFVGGFKGMRRPTQLRVIYGMGDGGCIQDAVDLIYNNCELNIGAAGTQVPATSGIIHIEGGTYVQDVIVEKSLTFNASNGSPVLNAGQSITLNNAAANTSATDCQTVVASNLNGGTTRFQAPTVYVNADQTDIAAATDRATVDMGILLVAPNGTVTIDAAGTFTENRATINKNNVTLNTSIATTKRTLDAITLNGSGACGGTASDIVDILVDSVFMASNVDCIQTALGNTDGNQDDEGVGGAAGANRQGTVAFTYAGNTAVAQALTVDKDVRFTGFGGGTTNLTGGSLTMRLGAQGTFIASSTLFCNPTVNVTQRTGSGFTQIPDIQDGITLACASGTVNVGDGAAMGSVSTWGGATDTYNRDNTINKSLTVQGLNTTNACANDFAAANAITQTTGGIANAARSAFTSTFDFGGNTIANPVFSLTTGVNSITIQGFNFTNIANGAANALIYAPGANNNVTIQGNVISGAVSEQYVESALSVTPRSTWNVSCNRATAPAAAPDKAFKLADLTGFTFSSNVIDYSAATSGNEPVYLGGIEKTSANSISDNIIVGSRTAGIFIHSNATAFSSNASGNISILRNRIGTNNRTSTANLGGLVFQRADLINAAVTISNNWIVQNNLSGIDLTNDGNSTTPTITHTFLSITDNFFDHTTFGSHAGIRYLGNTGAACGINARGNYWGNATLTNGSGPTSTFNPLNPVPCVATTFGVLITQTPTCDGSTASRVSFVPWWTNGTDNLANTNGWQAPAATNVLARVVRTNSLGVWISNHATIQLGVNAIGVNGDKVIAIQGVDGWLPAPGVGDDWGEYFSEQVTYSGALTGVEIRGTTISWYDCGVSALQQWPTYLATTSNTNGPVPSGDATAAAPASTISGIDMTGFYLNACGSSPTIRNFRIQGFSGTGANSVNGTQGKGILIQQVTSPTVDACYIEGSNAGAANGSVGVFLDRCTGGLIASTNIGFNKAISATSGNVGGNGILLADRSAADVTFGPNTVGKNTPVIAGWGIANGNNIIRNCERTGISLGLNNNAATTGSMGSTIIEYNTIQGVRDVIGTGSSPAISAIYADADGGDLRINNNILGGKGNTTENDNNVDITLVGVGASFTLNAGSTNNTIRDSAQVVDGENYTVTAENNLSGTRPAELRAFFSHATNTFSHAAILTTDANAPYTFGTQMSRNQPVVAIGGTYRIYRQIATPLANTSTTYGAGSETYNNVIEVRENAGWTINEIDQYFAENLSFVSTTGRVHQTILGPVLANGLNTNSAHIISTGPGTSTAITANGAENKYIRGGIVLHAIGSGLYGSIDASPANKGDVYLQRAASGTDAGFVQFAYHTTTFGSQALVNGGSANAQETIGNNNNTDKPNIIKAGLNDANDDAYTVTTAQNRRTGVFQAGNGTTFTKPTEPVAGLGVDGMTAYPNPSNGGIVNVQFSVPVDAMVRVALYDALGRKVTDLKEGSLSVGVYNTEFDVNNLPSGTYTVRMEYDYSVKTVQVHVIK